MCANVVVAEDDPLQSELVRRYLEHENHTVTIVDNGHDAIAHVRAHSPDLLILDVMMPGIDGLEVCRILRRDCDVAILMLTARSTEDDLLRGLDQGADDYMTKPFSPRELMARVRTLLRRRGSGASDEAEERLQVGALIVDPLRHEVSLDGAAVECTPAEFRLLEAFASNPGQVLTRAQLLGQMHGFAQFMTERTIDFHVKNLRKKLEPQPRRPVRLLTVYGVGYKLAEVSGPARAS